MGGLMALIFILAVLIEGIVEYFFEAVPARYKRYVAAVLGVTVCIIYNADLIAVLGYVAPIAYVGAAITGLVVGRGSNYLNDLVTRLTVIQAPAVPVDHVAADAETVANLERDIQRRRRP